ncbi:MAG: 4-hydroxybenzoate octaprenyltransferase [Bacteroidales bacterium]
MSIAKYLRLVKFAHTIFALPFALIGFALALNLTGNEFSLRLLILILVAMVTARNSAMGFNRYLDREFDAKNPRTKSREIPAGALSPKAALVFVLINSLLFLFTAYLINSLTFILAFPALAVLLGYSYMKRVSALCHYVLGLALAIAPTGAYLSIAGSFHPAPLILSAIVLLWVSGFDIIYALSDEEFDKENGLHSVPQLIGKKWGLIVSSVGHLLIVPLLVILYLMVNSGGVSEQNPFGWLYIAGSAIFSVLLLWQHLIVSPKNLTRINAAFFTLNGIASVLFSIFVISDLL